MNGKKSKLLRKASNGDRKLYQSLKRIANGNDGQHAKIASDRARKPKPNRPPSWPATPDQMKQNRPLIVVHPVRQLVGRKYSVWADTLRRECGKIQKWKLDKAAIDGYLV